MRALIAELRAQLVQLAPEPTTPVEQEGIWKGIKKVASKVADVADTAVSSVPVVGDVYNAGIGAYKANKAVYQGAKALGQWATGNKKAAASSLQKAKSAGADAVGRGVMAVASTVGAGGAAKLAGRALVKPAITAAVKTAGQAVVNRPTSSPSASAAPKPPMVPSVKKKKPVAAAASESVLFPSTRALVEFRSLVGLPITKEHQTQLEAEEAALDVAR